MLDKEKVLFFLKENQRPNWTNELDSSDNIENIYINKVISFVYNKLESGEFDISESKETCRWYPENSYSEHFSTSCKEIHYFDNEGIKSSGFKHCPYCGKPIEEVKGE